MKPTQTLLGSQTTLLLLVAVATATTACSSGDEPRDKANALAWTCATVDVPMGEAIHCTQGAMTMDGPVAVDHDVAITTPTSIYECNAGDADCPPADATPEPSPTPSGDTEPCSGADDNPDVCPPTSDGSTSDGSTANGNGNGKNSGGGNGNAGGNGNGKKSGGTSDTGDGQGESSGGSSGPPECRYVPDLPYCSGGESSGGASNGNGNGEGKKHYTCTRDGAGNKSCESVPECAPGSHPSACGACVSDGDSGDCVQPSDGGCWVTGGGFIEGPNLTTQALADGHDNFGGNAKPMKDGRVQGHWNHVDHGTGNHAKGTPAYIVCRHVDEPGPGQPGGKKGFTMNQVYFGGPAEWDAGAGWADGYWFDVVAKDHGEPGSQPSAKNGDMPDTYHFTIRKLDDPAQQVSGAIVYETRGELVGGNIQMHPPNNGHPYTPISLPSWVSYEP